MRRKAIYFSAALLLGLSFLIPSWAFAGIPGGTICFQDNYGELWYVDWGSYSSGINFDLHGFLLGLSECDGTFVQPLSGTATVEGNSLILGVVSNGGATGDCASASWHVPIDLTTFQGNGTWEDLQTGQTTNFSLSLIDCSSVLSSETRSLKRTGVKGLSRR